MMNLGQRAEMRVNARNECATADMRGLPGPSCRVVELRCIPANALTVVVAPERKAFGRQLLCLPGECPIFSARREDRRICLAHLDFSSIGIALAPA
jgi:hypothetical protein